MTKQIATWFILPVTLVLTLFWSFVPRVHATQADSDPDSATSAWRSATVAAEQGDFHTAVVKADEAMAADLTHPMLFYHRGRWNFRIGAIDNSLRDFDRFVKEVPERANAQWERGITCYYTGDFRAGSKQFEDYQKYHNNDVENAVWRYLCQMKFDGKQKARAAILPIQNDTRIPMMEIYKLFRGESTPAQVMDIVEIADGGEQSERQQRFHAHLYLALYFDSEGKSSKALEHAKAAVRQYENGGYMWAVAVQHVRHLRQQIRPSASLPESIPWDLESLGKSPAFSWEEGQEVRSLYYEGEPYDGKKTRVFAYYSTPATLSGEAPSRDRFPAIVLVHGGGGTAFPQWAKLWAERGYAAIAMDLAGCGPGRRKMVDGGPGQGHDMKFETIGQPVTEQWSYHAVANVIRAHSLIRSFPEVDLTRTAITGISWGGYLTCIVAGLDSRFQAACPVYGCGFLHENSVWLGDFAKMTPEHKAKWIKLWEPSQYVGSAAMPMLFVNGGKDFAYPPDSHAKTFELVRSRKYLHFVPDLPHGHIFDRPRAIEHFVEHQLNGGTPLAQISSPAIVDGKVVAEVFSSSLVVEAKLHYTEDQLSGDARMRKWVSVSAHVEENGISAKVPPESVTAWFLTVKDEREIVVSCPLVVVR